MLVTNKGQLGKDLVKCGELEGEGRDFRRGDAGGSPAFDFGCMLLCTLAGHCTKGDPPGSPLRFELCGLLQLFPDDPAQGTFNVLMIDSLFQSFIYKSLVATISGLCFKPGND